MLVLISSAAGLEIVLKPKTATCLRNQSSLLIDRFKSSFRPVIALQAGDDDSDAGDDGDGDGDAGGDVDGDDDDDDGDGDGDDGDMD